MPGGLTKTLRTGLLLLLAAAVAAFLTTQVLKTRTAGGDGFYGMVVGPTVDADAAMKRLGDLRVNTVRLQTDIRDWAQPSANTGSDAYDGWLPQATRLHKSGFRVVLLVNSVGGQMPSYARAKGVFEWLVGRPDAKKSLDVVEVMGPLTEQASNADAFSPTLTRAQQAERYVQGPLKAAADVFHHQKIKVLGGSFTLLQQSADFSRQAVVGTDVAKAYVNAGYLDYADYAGLQPYADSAHVQRDWTKRYTTVFPDTQIWISEWGLVRTAFPDGASYSQAMSDAGKALKDTVKVACYSGFTTGDGPENVVHSGLGGYQPNQPAYDTYRAWTH
jgi:hypothetical protein